LFHHPLRSRHREHRVRLRRIPRPGDDARGKDISRFAAISWCPFYKLFVCNNLMLETSILSVHNTAGLC